jgi:hypothetical protein
MLWPMKITTDTPDVPPAPTNLGALTRFRRPRLLPGLQVLHRGRGEV